MTNYFFYPVNLVGSSKIKAICGSSYNALARAILCLWPPENLQFLSPTDVCIFLGSLLINS